MMNTRKRIKKRYEWLVLFTIINWFAIGWVILRVDPEVMKDFIVPGSYLPMVVLSAGGFFWMLSILLMSAARALRWAIALAVFVELRVLGLGSLVNGLLIFGVLLSLEIFLSRSSPGDLVLGDEKKDN